MLHGGVSIMIEWNKFSNEPISNISRNDMGWVSIVSHSSDDTWTMNNIEKPNRTAFILYLYNFTCYILYDGDRWCRVMLFSGKYTIITGIEFDCPNLSTRDKMVFDDRINDYLANGME